MTRQHRSPAGLALLGGLCAVLLSHACASSSFTGPGGSDPGTGGGAAGPDGGAAAADGGGPAPDTTAWSPFPPEAEQRFAAYLPLFKDAADQLGFSPGYDPGPFAVKPWPYRVKAYLAREWAMFPLRDVLAPHFSGFIIEQDCGGVAYAYAYFSGPQTLYVAFCYDAMKADFDAVAASDPGQMGGDPALGKHYYNILRGVFHEVGHVIDLGLLYWFDLLAFEAWGVMLDGTSPSAAVQQRWDLRRLFLNHSWVGQGTGDGFQYVVSAQGQSTNNFINAGAAMDAGEDFAETSSLYYIWTRYLAFRPKAGPALEAKLADYVKVVYGSLAQHNEPFAQCWKQTGCQLSHFLARASYNTATFTWE